MESFIKRVWNGKEDEFSHRQFIRFGKGIFEKRAALTFMKTSKLKFRGSFEWANDFVILVSELSSQAKFSGKILSREEISGLGSGKKKTGIIEYEVSDISSDKIQEIKDKIYTMLLDAEGPEISLKTKKKLPKPGKSADAKVDDKFCQLEADLKYSGKISEMFMLPDCKKCSVHHTFEISEIVYPAGEKDPAKIREMAKRKGKIIRKFEVDKQERQEEKEFLA